MRTKTLALSTLLGAIGTATSLVAQTNVYSVNAVGYINVTIPPGWSILTCPLIASPDNTLKTLFPLPASVPSGGATDQNLFVTVFSGGHFGAGDSISYSGGWNGGGTITINPGQAVFVNNPNPIGSGINISNTFVGTVPQNNNYNMTNTLIPGYNLVGSIVPVTGTFVNPIVNLSNAIGAVDFVLYFNPAQFPNHTPPVQTGFETEVQGSYSLGWGGGPGVNGSPVSTNVAQGFYYYNATAALNGQSGQSIIGTVHTSNEYWVENFTVNP